MTTATSIERTEILCTRRVETRGLIERGEDRGCVNLSDLSELVTELDLAEEENQALHDRLDARGVELSDDCGNGAPPGPVYNHDELVVMTSDTLQLFLRDVRRHPLLTAEEEVELAKAIEAFEGDQPRRVAKKRGVRGEDERCEGLARDDGLVAHALVRLVMMPAISGRIAALAS